MGYQLDTEHEGQQHRMSRGGGRGINASLAVQAERLKTSMQSRDKRRSREAQQRQVLPLSSCTPLRLILSGHLMVRHAIAAACAIQHLSLICIF